LTGLRKGGARADSSQNNVKASAAAVAAVRAPDGGDFWRMAGGRQPVMNCSANLASLDWRAAGPSVTCDQYDDPLSRCDCGVETAIDRSPCLVERQAVKIEYSVGLYGSGAKLAVPACVEGPGRGSSERYRPFRATWSRYGNWISRRLRNRIGLRGRLDRLPG